VQPEDVGLLMLRRFKQNSAMIEITMLFVALAGLLVLVAIAVHVAMNVAADRDASATETVQTILAPIASDLP